MHKQEYSLDGKRMSSFNKGELVEPRNTNKGKHFKKEVENWSVLLGVESIEKGISPIEKSLTHNDPFTRAGIAYEFSKLKTDKEINTFANKYGLLGIAPPSEVRAQVDFELKEIMGDSIYFSLPHGFSLIEPLEIWKFYIDQIRKILKLYKTLVNIHNGTEENQIEGNLLNIGEEFDKYEPKYFIEWWDGTPTGTGIYPDTAEEGDFLKIARKVLISSISYQANRSLNNFATRIIETNKPPLGFYVEEGKISKHLINAIYYDLWALISKNEPVSICQNPNCKLPFKKVKRQKYCSNACKQEAYRIRKGIANK